MVDILVFVIVFHDFASQKTQCCLQLHSFSMATDSGHQTLSLYQLVILRKKNAV